MTLLALGFVLGGTAGIGTAVVAVLGGPSVEASFWLICRVGLAAARRDTRGSGVAGLHAMWLHAMCRRPQDGYRPLVID